jgi:hypothetical protein
MNHVHERAQIRTSTEYLDALFRQIRLRKITQYHRQDSQEDLDYPAVGLALYEQSGFYKFAGVNAKYV